MWDIYLLSVGLFCYAVLVSSVWKHVGMRKTCNEIGVVWCRLCFNILYPKHCVLLTVPKQR